MVCVKVCTSGKEGVLAWPSYYEKHPTARVCSREQEGRGCQAPAACVTNPQQSYSVVRAELSCIHTSQRSCFQKENLNTLLVGIHISTINKKTVQEFLRKLKRHQAYDPAIPLQGTYPKEIKSAQERDTCIPMLNPALFTVAKTCNQFRKLSTDAWKKKMQYTYMTEYYRTIKMNKILAFATDIIGDHYAK